jgi:hypothetical protein
MTQRVTVGASVLVYVNNQPYGKAKSFRMESLTPRDPVNGIDSLDPLELAPTKTAVRGTLEVFRTRGDGGAEGSGMTTSFEKLPREKYFSVTLVDRLTTKVIFRADYCSVVSQSWDFNSKEMVRGVIQFEALDWTNETEN